MEQQTISYPAWGKASKVKEFFGVGRVQLEQWRAEGLVLTDRCGNVITYRMSDIDRVKTARSIGTKPPAVKRNSLTAAMRR